MKSSEKKNTFVEDEKIINEDESNAVFLNLFFFFKCSEKSEDCRI